MHIRARLNQIWNDLLMSPAYYRLFRSQSGQYARFSKFAGLFAERYYSVCANADTRTSSAWMDYSRHLEQSLLPRPPWDFLREPVIRSTMVITRGGQNLKLEKNALRAYWPNEELRVLVREDPVGHPYLADTNLLTSHNSIHHAHHLTRFLQATNADIGSIQIVVEWGGGYGNLAKMWRRIAKQPHAWIIFDIPVLATVQWLYLTSVLGEDKVRLISSPGIPILEDGITIIPTRLLDAYPIKADFFVSTWAISESPAAMQDIVIRKRWFNAKHLLLAYQASNPSFPDADRIGSFALQDGATIEGVPALSGQHYAFR